MDYILYTSLSLSLSIYIYVYIYGLRIIHNIRGGPAAGALAEALPSAAALAGLASG